MLVGTQIIHNAITLRAEDHVGVETAWCKAARAKFHAWFQCRRMRDCHGWRSQISLECEDAGGEIYLPAPVRRLTSWFDFPRPSQASIGGRQVWSDQQSAGSQDSNRNIEGERVKCLVKISRQTDS